MEPRSLTERDMLLLTVAHDDRDQRERLADECPPVQLDRTIQRREKHERVYVCRTSQARRGCAAAQCMVANKGKSMERSVRTVEHGERRKAIATEHKLRDPCIDDSVAPVRSEAVSLGAR